MRGVPDTVLAGSSQTLRWSTPLTQPSLAGMHTTAVDTQVETIIMTKYKQENTKTTGSIINTIDNVKCRNTVTYLTRHYLPILIQWSVVEKLGQLT